MLNLCGWNVQIDGYMIQKDIRNVLVIMLKGANFLSFIVSFLDNARKRVWSSILKKKHRNFGVV